MAGSKQIAQGYKELRSFVKKSKEITAASLDDELLKLSQVIDVEQPGRIANALHRIESWCEGLPKSHVLTPLERQKVTRLIERVGKGL